MCWNKSFFLKDEKKSAAAAFSFGKDVSPDLPTFLPQFSCTRQISGESSQLLIRCGGFFPAVLSSRLNPPPKSRLSVSSLHILPQRQ